MKIIGLMCNDECADPITNATQIINELREVQVILLNYAAIKYTDIVAVRLISSTKMIVYTGIYEISTHYMAIEPYDYPCDKFEMKMKKAILMVFNAVLQEFRSRAHYDPLLYRAVSVVDDKINIIKDDGENGLHKEWTYVHTIINALKVIHHDN